MRRLPDGSRITAQRTPRLAGQDVWLRDEPPTKDRQVWADTFTGLYHLPPHSMPTPRTVLDLGANIGLTVAHYRFLWPDAKIVAVEMDDLNADVAEVNVPDVTVRRVAVGGYHGDGHYSPTWATDAYQLGRDGDVLVRVETLDEIIIEEFDSDIDFVKMDVEGAEWGIFRVADRWAPLVGYLLVELHGDGGSDLLVSEAIRLLAPNFPRVSRHERHPQAVFATR